MPNKGLQAMHIPKVECDYMHRLIEIWSNRAGAALCAIVGMQTRYIQLSQLKELASQRVETNAPTYDDIINSHCVKMSKLEWSNLTSTMLKATEDAILYEDAADDMQVTYTPIRLRPDEVYENISCERLALLKEEKLDLDEALKSKQCALAHLKKYGIPAIRIGYVSHRCYMKYSYHYEIQIPARKVRMMIDSIDQVLKKLDKVNEQYKTLEEQYKSKAATERAMILDSGCRLHVRFA